MIAEILISAGLFYYLSLPFASVLQGGGYRIQSMIRAKKEIYGCLIYLIICAVGEVCILVLLRKWIARILTAAFYLATAVLVLLIHGKMQMRMHYTHRLIRLLITSLLTYTALYFVLFITQFRGLWAVTPAVAPIHIVFVSGIISPFEKRNNRRYVDRASRILSESSALKIGVTGSYGKTSIKHYLELLLSKKYKTLATPENYNTPLGIAKTVEAMSGKEEVMILEMGARRIGDIRELVEVVHPNIGVITGIAPQHLETFRSLEAILSEKNTLAESISDQSVVYYNLTDPLVRRLYDLRSGRKVGVGYREAEYIISEERYNVNGSSFRLSNGARSEVITIPCVGRACVVNFALAAVVAIEQGVSWEDVVIVARDISVPAHRFEIVRKGDVTVIDDSYNINTVGAAVALDTLESFSGKRKVVYTSGIVELGKDEEYYNRRLGARIADVASFVIVSEGRYGDAVVRGIGEREGVHVIRVKDTKEASGLFPQILRKGDVLLIMSDLPRDYLL